MDRIKGTLISILIIFLIIIIPVGVINGFFDFIINAVKWIVFIDNAETGLPMIAEMIIKGVVEGLVVLILGYIGIKEKNPIATIMSIIVGFVACVIIYWIAKYIIWILIGLLLIVIAYVIYLLIKNHKDKNKLIKGESENEKVGV